MQTQIHRMRIEIEARVEWGNDPESIREWMYEQDTSVSERQLEKILRHALKRKAGTLTTGGAIRAALGLLLIGLAVLLFATNLPSLLIVLSPIPFILVFFAVLAIISGCVIAFQGLNQLIDGLARSAEVPKPPEGAEDEGDEGDDDEEAPAAEFSATDEKGGSEETIPFEHGNYH